MPSARRPQKSRHGSHAAPKWSAPRSAMARSRSRTAEPASPDIGAEKTSHAAARAVRQASAGSASRSSLGTAVTIPFPEFSPYFTPSGSFSSSALSCAPVIFRNVDVHLMHLRCRCDLPRFQFAEQIHRRLGRAATRHAHWQRWTTREWIWRISGTRYRCAGNRCCAAWNSARLPEQGSYPGHSRGRNRRGTAPTARHRSRHMCMVICFSSPP